MTNKLDEQLIEMVLKNHTYFQYGALMHTKDMDFAKEFVSQIKQSILKAIMEKMPKKLRHITNTKGEKNTENTEWDRLVNDAQEEIDMKNDMIDKFESVIKEILK